MTYRISDAARLVGIPATTLRYYEDIGLVERPARGGNGYRAYDADDVARLRFITAAKSLGIPLADVADLVRAYDVEDCSTVAHQVVEAVELRLAEAQARVAELVALAAQLQDVAARLRTAPAAGPCGEGCPCSAAGAEPAVDRRTLVPLTARPAGPDALVMAHATDGAGPAIACSLDAASTADRVEQWRALLASAVRREPLAGGVAVVLPTSAPLAAEAARLAAAEQACCAFFTFDLRLTTGEVRLEVRAPDDAADVVAALFGTAVQPS